MTHACAPSRLDLVRALALRDLNARSVFIQAVGCAAAGIAAGWVAAAIPDGSGGAAANVVLRFDSTLAVIFALTAIVRTMTWLDNDADADWCLQIMAAGGSRDLFMLSLPAVTAAVSMCGWLCGAACFALTLAQRGHDTAALFRVAAGTGPAALLFLSAAGFGCAVGAVVRGAAGFRLAAALLVAPWIAVWLTLPVTAGTSSPGLLIRLLSYPAPRLFLATSLTQVAFVVFYCGVVLLIPVVMSDGRVGRRS